MRYVVESDKSPEQACIDLESAVTHHGFGVLHTFNLKGILASKGFELPNACHIFEICNPQQAVNVLTDDMGMNVALPCRVSVYTEDGQTRIAMMKPTAMLSALSDSPALREVAEEVEAKITAMIDEAA